MSRQTDAQKKEELSQLNGIEIQLPSITSDQSLEPVVTQEFDKTVSEEAFMNEILEIEVASSTDENQPNHIVLDVNNLKQPVFRGQPTRMRRMFVEVLARCKETKYTQIQNPFEPDRQEMRPRTALAYPFTVLHDPNRQGGAWLKAVLAEAN